MGCDIHLFLERQCSKQFPEPQWELVREITEEPSWRNYECFRPPSRRARRWPRRPRPA